MNTKEKDDGKNAHLSETPGGHTANFTLNSVVVSTSFRLSNGEEENRRRTVTSSRRGALTRNYTFVDFEGPQLI